MAARIGWVDAVKGFAMLCIILGHFCAFFMPFLQPAQLGFVIIGTFQVPLFFLMSGYTTSPKKWLGASGIKKLAQRCFLPYIFAGVVSVVMCLIFVDPARLYDYVFGFFYGAGAYRDHILFGDTRFVNAIGLIWFLPTLFVGKVIACALWRLNIYVRLAITAALFLAAGETAPILFLPFDIQQGMCAAWYMTAGMWLKAVDAFGAGSKIWVKCVVAAAILFGVYYIFATVNGTFGLPMYCNSTYHQPVVDLFATVCTCVVVIAAVKVAVSFIKPLDAALTWCGLYSMGLFIYHAITLSPGDEVKWWIYKLVENGGDAAALFFLLLGINLVIVFGMTVASKYIKPLRWILYGAKVPS